MARALPGVALVVRSGRLQVRANDQAHRFRAASDFIWLTGCDDAGAVLVLDHDGAPTLFIRAPHARGSVADHTDRVAGRVWVGVQPEPDEVAHRLGLEVRPLSELPRALEALDPNATRHLDPQVGEGADVAAVLHELRLCKDEYEVGQLELAVAATVRGFEDVVGELGRATRSGERWLEGTFDRRARTDGHEPGYQTIVAAGPDASVLHWTRNDGPVRPGKLLLMDAGVEVRSHYTADITRTLPIDGHYTPPQRDVYTLVLASQRAGIEAVRPGASYGDIYDACMRVIVDGLDAWGLLPEGPDAALDPEGQHHRRYTVCGTGHMLGLDVHDCAAARDAAYAHGTLAPGHVLTVEPGLYFQPDDLTVPAELRGMGVRIEDDVLVTRSGHRVLSDALPSEPDAVEAWLAAR